MKTENMFLEVNGEIVGQVISEDDETLLIRKGYLHWHGDAQIFLATELAVFVEKSLVKSHWVKSVRSSCIVEAFNIVDSRKFVCEFFNM